VKPMTMPAEVLDWAMQFTTMAFGPAEIPKPLFEETITFSILTLEGVPKAVRWTPPRPQELADPLEIAMLLRVPSRMTPMSEPATPSSEKPLRSMVTLLAAISMPWKPLMPVRLEER
jgi:hypothetical protein